MITVLISTGSTAQGTQIIWQKKQIQSVTFTRKIKKCLFYIAEEEQLLCLYK